jgi:hypothetical protein
MVNCKAAFVPTTYTIFVFYDPFYTQFADDLIKTGRKLNFKKAETRYFFA